MIELPHYFVLYKLYEPISPNLSMVGFSCRGSVAAFDTIDALAKIERSHPSPRSPYEVASQPAGAPLTSTLPRQNSSHAPNTIRLSPVSWVRNSLEGVACLPCLGIEGCSVSCEHVLNGVGPCAH